MRKEIEFTFDERVSFARSSFERAVKKFGDTINPSEILLSLRVHGVLMYHEPSDTYRLKPKYENETLPDDLNNTLYDYNNSPTHQLYRMKRGMVLILGERRNPK